MKLTGTWLVLASVGFWLAWLLMPGVGVTDTTTIFALVSQHRREVYASVILQLVSAAAYAAFFAGHVVVVWARRRHDFIAKCASWLLITLPAVALLGAIARRAELLSGRVVGLAVLGALSGSLGLVGISIARGRTEDRTEREEARQMQS